jgi:hypothetical protein
MRRRDRRSPSGTTSGSAASGASSPSASGDKQSQGSDDGRGSPLFCRFGILVAVADRVTPALRPEVETLLDGEARARLPLAQQVQIYLDPFALFKDASSGPAPVRARAASYNRAMRWMLLPYIRRWVVIAAALALLISPVEAAAAQQHLYAIPMAAVAVGCCIAVTIVAVTVAVYLLLGRRVV